MPGLFRYVAPAGTPIGLPDLVHWATTALALGDPATRLADAVAARTGTPHVFLTSTGRAGMTILLRAMHRLRPGRAEVVLPSYTCYSVAASVIKAGLTPRIVDISSETLDYAPDALAGTDFSRVLALVATNLYGLPNDMPALQRLARAEGAFLVDDAAQALGATVAQRHSGTWGDAGLYSFDKGKNVAAIDGGVVVTASDDLAAAIRLEMAALPRPGTGSAAIMVAKTLVYAALLRPWLYWIPNRVPQLKLGQTVFTTDFPLAAPGRPETALAATMFRHLDALTHTRRANAEAILQGLRGVTGVAPVRPADCAEPVYLRLPVLAPSGTARDHLLARLTAEGIGATGSYPRSLAEIAELERAPGGPRIVVGPDVARRILTLPTHPYVRATDIVRIVDVLSNTSASVTPGMVGAA